jgi:Ser/Thr protein kinase RdoA (MazF antagonist)
LIISPADYPIEGSICRRHPGGFESDCWVVDDAWFVKVWRRAHPPDGLDLLARLRSAGLPVPVPIPTRAGELFAWWQGRPYAVFPFLAGRAADDRDHGLTARMVRRVQEVAN